MKCLEKIIILDFGSQTTQLIARRLRELHVYCEVVPYDKFPHGDKSVIGVVLSGSPFSVNADAAFKPDLSQIRGRYPLLGICYGAQYLASLSGGKIEPTGSREYGRAKLTPTDADDPLMKNLPKLGQVWMSHGDTITKLPRSFRAIARTDDVPVAAFRVDGEDTWAVQFHPEVYHTEIGQQVLDNFLTIAKAKRDWTPASFIDTTVAELKQRLGKDKAILALSGGVDSSTAALLLHRAIGDQLTCIFVDNGLLRKNEFKTVMKDYQRLDLNVIGVDAKKYFYDQLSGVTDPEQKRKIIGAGFVDIFQRQADKIENVKWLAQGTIYPDVIESLSITGTTIKSHHNVGGLSKTLRLKLVEPLRTLFKDEVRAVGRELGLPADFVERHPFPGPGLAIRIIGDVTPQKVKTLQDVDDIFISLLRRHKLYDQVWQAGAILLPIQSVGVMGDERTYENAVALRAVTSTDAMTADWAHLPYDFLAEVSNQVIRRVRGVNRVTYDISSKPPSTIEWE
jgi:GMP synthase (glutamine-hydrolysing)